MSASFVDTHVHFNNFKHPTLDWNWLHRDYVHPFIGDIDEIKHVRYEVEGLRAETRFANVSKIVHIQNAHGSPDPVDETAWLQEMADRTGWPNAIIAYSDLASATVGRELDRHREYANFRGIRDISDRREHGDLADPAFQRGCAQLAQRGLILDFLCQWEEMGKAYELAHSLPELTMVLEHAGQPHERSDQYFVNWSREMAQLAEAENVICKISGLGMKDRQWTLESLRPWVMRCIECFGIDRCVFGSNWPVDRLFSSYDALVNAYRSLVGGFNAGERRALLSENAERIYRI